MTANSAKSGFTLKDKRKSYRTSVKVESGSGTAGRRFYRSLDISVSGLSLSTEFPPPLGEAVVIEFKMPMVLETIRVTAEVVRILMPDPPGGRVQKTPPTDARPYGFGVKFLELQPVQQQVIREFIQSDKDESPGPA